MGVFDFESTGGGIKGWNYSNAEKADFKLTLSGTVVEVIRKQGRDYMTGQPKVWPNGDPKPVFQIVVKQANGDERGFTFYMKTYDRMAKRTNYTKAAIALMNALRAAGFEKPSLEQLLGKEISISTRNGAWSVNNPREFAAEISGDGDVAAVRGCTDLLGKPQVQPEPEFKGVYQEDIPF